MYAAANNTGKMIKIKKNNERKKNVQKVQK